jgi:hypothetical protein
MVPRSRRSHATALAELAIGVVLIGLAVGIGLAVLVAVISAAVR